MRDLKTYAALCMRELDRLNIRVLPPMSPVTAYVGIAVSGQ